MTADIDLLATAAERELEAALRGASLCAVSRDPAAGASTVKFLEGRWYTLRDVQRRMAVDPSLSIEEAAGAVERDAARRTPQGDAWRDYRAGAQSVFGELSGDVHS